MNTGWAKLQVGEFQLDAQWHTRPGEVLALFGPSGSGKSLTLQIIAGLIRPDQGVIEIDGITVVNTTSNVWLPPYQRRIGYVPQDYGLFPHLSVEANVAFGLARWARKEARSRTRHLLQAFHLEPMANRRPHELSGGERQRVALARALAPQPTLLLLDEPFSALDAALRRELRRELRSYLRKWLVPVILVTHDLDDVLALANHVIVLNKGQVMAKGDPIAVLNQTSQAGLTGLENTLEATIESINLAEGTMICSASGISLEVPTAPFAVGQQVRLRVRSTDILLATERPRGISARNIIPGHVVDLDPLEHEYEVRVNCGLPLRARLTRGSVVSLKLVPGKRIWAVIKASALVILSEP